MPLELNSTTKSGATVYSVHRTGSVTTTPPVGEDLVDLRFAGLDENGNVVDRQAVHLTAAEYMAKWDEIRQSGEPTAAEVYDYIKRLDYAFNPYGDGTLS